MNISRFTEERPDGALWQVYDLPSGGQVILTSQGRELFSRHPDALKLMHEYRKSVIGRCAGASAIRQHLKSGGNSDVYSVGPDLAVKEGLNTQSLMFALNRMDGLFSVIEKSVPRWIDIPAHYGLLYSRELDRQYMLMQKVDNGVTVEDVLSLDEDPDTRQEVEAVLGPMDIDRQEEVRRRFALTGIVLNAALASNDLDPSDYLPDFHPGNVLVTGVRTPIAGSNFKLWVIDQ